MNRFDPLGLATTPKEREAELWQKLSSAASTALSFWITFFNMQTDDGKPLTPKCVGNFLCIIRAVSWVESKHGTVGANHPDRDPMQTANPQDRWWRELTGQAGNGSRFIGGPYRQNYWSFELPAAINEFFLGNPASVYDLNNLEDKRQGHRNAAFTPAMSYFWATPYLLNKINGSKVFKCGQPCPSQNQMVNGAVNYNGGGDPNYRSKIQAALKPIQCMQK